MTTYASVCGGRTGHGGILGKGIGILGVGLVLAVSGCGDDEDAARITAREQLSAPASFEIQPEPSYVVLRERFTYQGEEELIWVELPIDVGTLATVARAEAMSLDDFTMEFAPVELPTDIFPFALELRHVKMHLMVPMTCGAAWATDGEAMSCADATVLAVDWTLGVGGRDVALDSRVIGPVDLTMGLTHVGDQLRMTLVGASHEVDWRWGGLVVHGDLALDLRAHAPAESTMP